MLKKCTPLWREAHFEVKMYKTHHSRTTFGSWDVEKVHAVVVRSTFWSQNVQNTPFSDHFWKLRCWKSARRCGAKHILKSKCTKHTILGPLLEVEMSKKCTPLWREAHFEVKMYKTHQVRTTFGSWDVEKVHAVVARSTFPSHFISFHFVSCLAPCVPVMAPRRKVLCNLQSAASLVKKVCENKQKARIKRATGQGWQTSRSSVQNLHINWTFLKQSNRIATKRLLIFSVVQKHQEQRSMMTDCQSNVIDYHPLIIQNHNWAQRAALETLIHCGWTCWSTLSLDQEKSPTPVDWQDHCVV